MYNPTCRLSLHGLIRAPGLLIGLAAGTIAPAHASEPGLAVPQAPSTVRSDIGPAQRHAALLERSTTDGTVWMIVQLRMPEQPQGLSEASRRANLSAAQQWALH